MTKIPALFDKFIFLLIVVNLISMVLESEPWISDRFRFYLSSFEVISISIFSLEYVYRSIVAYKTKRKYNWTFFGIIDLLSVLPFFFDMLIGFDGRFIRVFRLFRISRILKLGKFSKSFELLGRGINNVQKELYITFFIAFIMLFFSASGIYYLENPEQPQYFSSITESFWWSVSSLTGVGFEEIFPQTFGGKLFGTFISLIGIGVVAVPTGIISASFVEVLDQEKNKE
ncbi:MAG: ion transporter [Flavobacteriaceae bacterium]|jgi:voltage-gated potassium channel|nr:ion transporter [Flavobacteriaceae bacterium]